MPSFSSREPPFSFPFPRPSLIFLLIKEHIAPALQNGVIPTFILLIVS